ncbi:MAG: ATP synthase F1 subunit gamma [Chloroflexi bacterium]|jgi:F-type H+-transporting ATPase subunit gamma|nr:ATP synthase F1 subunit gamma [Chloroflexota bacterium]|tara:strand:+ start:5374 stop:6237 length:864 start_codon:yes stop_codon:yes gene_type:complete
MASTKELRTRIKSITNTAKVTGAMQMIAASKLRKAQDAAENYNIYSTNYENIKNSILNSADFDLLAEYSDLFKSHENSDENVLYLVISSNRGLSGPLFGNLVKTLEENTKQVNKKSFVSLGKKIDKYINSRNLNLLNTFEMKDEFTSEDVELISDYIVDEFIENQYTSVKLVYSHFNSVANQKAEIIDLLPFKQSKNSQNVSNHIFEPNQLDLIFDFAPKYVFIMIFRSILDSLASEHAARMVAMQNATDNANELVDDLTLDLNKARQETITSELLDLVGGMSAIEN